MKILTLIIAILISTTVIAKQKFYKWTDENGNIHYSSAKPENIKTDEINVNTNQPKVSQNIEITDEVEEQGTTEKSYLEKRREKKQKAKELAKKNKSQCLQARQTVTKYQQKVRMSKTDEKTGDKVYLEDSKREEIIKSAKKAVNKYCN